MTYEPECSEKHLQWKQYLLAKVSECIERPILWNQHDRTRDLDFQTCRGGVGHIKIYPESCMCVELNRLCHGRWVKGWFYEKLQELDYVGLFVITPDLSCTPSIFKMRWLPWTSLLNYVIHHQDHACMQEGQEYILVDPNFIRHVMVGHIGVDNQSHEIDICTFTPHNTITQLDKWF